MSLDLTNEKISYTFQRLIQTDGTGGFYTGVGDPVVISQLQFFYQATPHTGQLRPGDRWFNSNTGREYTYINDGDSSQWVEPYR